MVLTLFPTSSSVKWGYCNLNVCKVLPPPERAGEVGERGRREEETEREKIMCMYSLINSGSYYTNVVPLFPLNSTRAESA